MICHIIDIDECEEDTDGCEDGCVNTEPGFHCTCDEGELDLDGKSCTSKHYLVI